MTKIDLNRTSEEKLAELKGVGPIKAKRIIDYRNEQGLFSDIQELINVKGFGQKLISQIENKIKVIDDRETNKLSGEIDTGNNEVTVVFEPQRSGINNPGEVHLVGEMNDWDPRDKSYSLEKQPDGSWLGSFVLEKGTEYKIMYDSDSWEAEKHIGNGLNNLVI